MGAADGVPGGGRDGELAAVSQFVHEADEGPGFVLLRGETGIGKTTVWRHAIAQANARGYAVLTARPTQSESTLSFAALGDLLDNDAVDGAISTLAPPQRAALEVALLRRSPGGATRDWRAVGLAVLAVLRHLAAARPTIVAIDDVQWTDLSTARVVGFALRRLNGEHIRLVAATRDPTGASRRRSDPGNTLLEGLAVTERRIGPLDAAALGRVVRRELGASFSEQSIVELHAASGGNPFFALEIGRAMLRESQRPLPGQPLPVPRNLRDLVRDRISALGDATLEVLLVAASVSRPRTSLVLAAVGDSRRVAEGLDEAERAGVVQVDGDRITFAHPLLASTIYAGATATDRRRLHRAIADKVDDPEERVRHLALATSHADESVAAALEQVARTTRARGAPDAAATLAEEAVRLTPREQPADSRRRTLDAAEYHFGSGNMARAHALLEPLLELAPAGPERARVLLRLGEVQGQQFGFQPAAGYLERALAEAQGDPRLEVEIRVLLGAAEFVSGDIPRARDQAHEALRLAGEVGDAGLLIEPMSEVILFDFLMGLGVREDLISREAQLTAGGGAAADPRPGLGHFRTMSAMVLKWAGRLEESRARLLAAQQRIVDLGDVTWMPNLLYHLSELECWAGNFDLAEAYALDGIDAAERAGQEEVLTAALYSKALVEAHRGDLERARATAQNCLELCSKTDNVPVSHLALATLGFIDLSAGNYEAVRRGLGPLVEGVQRIGLGDPGVVRFVPDAIEALVALGDIAGAEALLRPFEEQARRLDRVWALATSERSRALLLAAQGELLEATAHAKAALRHHSRLDQPFELGRTLLVAGSVARRARRQAEARQHFEAALALFERLGAAAFAERTRVEMVRIQSRTRGRDELTPTERSVAELVSAGLTNREVADRLFVSVRTVESNLSRIYAKLDVRSRTELARRLPPGGSPT